MRRAYVPVIVSCFLVLLLGCRGASDQRLDEPGNGVIYPFFDPVAEKWGVEYGRPGGRIGVDWTPRVSETERVWTLYYEGEKSFVERLWSSRAEPWGGDPVDGNRREVLAEHLRRTVPLRASEAHPERGGLAPEDLEVGRLVRLEPRNRYLSVEMTYAKYRAPDGLQVTALWESESGVLRIYRRDDVRGAIIGEIKAGTWDQPKLTPAEAAEQAKAYLKALLTDIPDDLRLARMGFFSPGLPLGKEDTEWEQEIDSLTGVWFFLFERYSGEMLYPNREGIELHFSERHGVSFYGDYRFSEAWAGGELISRSEAIEKAQAFFDEWAKGRETMDGRTASVILGTHAYTIDGAPRLVRVDPTDPRVVRPYWIVNLERCVAVGADEIHNVVYAIGVDAETGEVHANSPVGRENRGRSGLPQEDVGSIGALLGGCRIPADPSVDDDIIY